MNYPNPHGPSCPWYDITEKTGAPNIKWCEETLCQWVSEPANTWSNLSYLIIALVIMYLGIKNRHNSNMRQFGPIVFFMGAMSFFYHQSNFYGSQMLDFIGMFFFLGWGFGMNLVRLGTIKPKNLIWFNLALSTAFTVLTHVMYLMGSRFQGIVLLMGFVIIASEVKAQKAKPGQYKWLLSTIGILIVAFCFSLMDGKRIWCDPTAHGWFSQGHAVWHWINSFAMLTLYLHHSQDSLKPSEPIH